MVSEIYKLFGEVQNSMFQHSKVDPQSGKI